MNKADLISLVAKEVDLPKGSVSKCVDAFLEAVQQQVAAGEKVSLIGFGTFSSRVREARTCLNPRTREKMSLPARKHGRFVIGKKFKMLLEETSA
jgi:DNA-binding protein HU-beta